jgi:hypothetical protein
MSLSRRCLYALLAICLSFPGTVLTVASADKTDCGMDMSMSAAPVAGAAHLHAGHAMMSDSDQSGAGDCCAADASARTDCLAMLDCHRCSGFSSVTSFVLADEFLTAIPVASANVATIPLTPPASSPPSDRWRPPINA